MSCPANQFRDQGSSPIREIFPNRFPLALITNSKQSDFENRTKRAESTGSERNRPFGEQWGNSASQQSIAQITNGYRYSASPRRPLGENCMPAHVAEGEELGSNLLRVMMVLEYTPVGQTEITGECVDPYAQKAQPRRSRRRVRADMKACPALDPHNRSGCTAFLTNLTEYHCV